MPLAPSPLLLEVEPVPLRAARLFSLAGDLTQLHFHLTLRNRSRHPLQLTALELSLLRDGARLIRKELLPATLAGRLRAAPWVAVRDRQTLAAALRLRSALRRPRGDTSLGPGEVASLPHLFLLLRPEETPDQLEVRISTAAAATAVQRFTVETYRQGSRLRLPVGGRWQVLQGHRFDEEHAGAPLGSQTFAYDLGVLRGEGRTFSGDPRRAASYHAYGQPVLAAADGEVVRVQDGVPDNEPVGSRLDWEQVLRRPEDLAGNYVVIQHQPGEHSAYLHLQPGLDLRPGQQVRAGQPIGRCGNSGNSLEPHLHFQLQDGPDPLRAGGLPAYFSNFSLEHLHLLLHVAGPRPLPVGLPVQAGRIEGASDLDPRPQR